MTENQTVSRLLQSVPVVNKRHPDHEKFREHNQLVFGHERTPEETVVLDVIAACGRLAEHLAGTGGLTPTVIKDQSIDLAFLVLENLPHGRLDRSVLEDWLRSKAAAAGVKLSD